MAILPQHLSALMTPQAYPHSVRALQLIETHISWIVLTGEFAYKIKRPVKYSFVDQRSLETRKFLCQEEVRLNRRFSPELYLGVCRITVRGGVARIEGNGRAIEHAVKMRQFSQDQGLDRLLEVGRIEPAELELFGQRLAQIHSQLPPTRQDPPGAVAAIVLDNLKECTRLGRSLGWSSDPHALRAPLEDLLASSAPLRSQRLAHGFVRECHGDLHARNIVRNGARLVAFDCLEFNPVLRWIDLADEIAFLQADLDARGCPLHAHAFLTGYLTESGDYQACVLQPLFQAHRALVRATIVALRATQTVTAADDISAGYAEYASYVDCAYRAVAPQQPLLVLMCGLSGSGKTWLARRLAPRLAAVHLRSDIERRRLAGLSATVRTGSTVGAGLYSRQMSQTVYERLAVGAAEALRGRYTTIVDATFGCAEDRLRLCEVATRLDVRSCIIYCHAPRQLLEAQILDRERRQDDPSEANLAVLAWQEEGFVAPEPHEASALVEVSSPDSAAIESLIARLSALRM
jgi:uncharacterized protein